MILIKSFRLNKNYPVCMLFDMLWIILITAVWIVTINIIFSGATPFAELSKIGFDAQQVFSNYGTVPGTLVEKARIAYDGTVSFFWMAGTLLLLFSLVAILISSVIKGAIWARVQNKRFDKDYLLGFIRLNYTWYLMWSLVILLTSLLPKAAMIILIAVEIMVMFLTTPLVRVGFDPKKRLLQNLEHIFKIIRPKILIMALLMYIMLLVIALITILTSFSYYIAPIIMMVLAFWYVSWTRHYLMLTVK